jgi:hypothetical protein
MTKVFVTPLATKPSHKLEISEEALLRAEAPESLPA